MKVTQAEKLFIGKLEMIQSENRRHTQYRLTSAAGSEIPLLTVVCVSRGSKELRANNLKGLSDVFFMSPTEFRSASKCEICPSLCVMGMSVAILKKAKLEIELDPILNDWNSSLLYYLPDLLNEVDLRRGEKLGKRDAAFAKKLTKELDGLSKGAQGQFRKYTKRCLSLLGQ